MSLPSFLTVKGDLVFLSVKAQPRASKNEIGEVVGDQLKVKVTAPPVDSAANDAIVRLLAETIGCARGSIAIVRGATSRNKIIAVSGQSADRILEALAGT